MTITERALGLIGLERMTNREKIMEELEALDNGAFYDMMANNRVCMAMETCQCEDCHRANGGRCPRPGDDASCALTTETWLDWTCQRERLLPEVGP